ncbi:aminopeptidase P family protein [Pseudoclavibacter sp. CFCC 14310]|uniref:aminopeptidase P family protein n=1 Tax=Pseudoclavibacter sp. CFCC 14310 TaxID=2615180 RepID=UPI0013019791|nr:aminopeptidase P family protein [Pseudoclavibacter sp. CFCC 14310]KAB1647626.1 aminopeptidase P family protein [Pseudoclavibacter sp. CFCC 14310]
MSDSAQKPGEARSRTPKNEHFRTYISQGWADREAQVPDTDVVARFAEDRRDRLHAMLPEHTLVVPAGDVKVRSNDTDFRFRPHSAFTHLTAWGADAVPGAVLVLPPVDSDDEPVLLFRKPAGRDTDEFYADPAIGEFWNGPRPGLDEIAARLGVSTADIRQLPSVLGAHTGPVSVIAGVDANADAAVDDLGERHDAAGDSLLERDASELRLVKDSWEIAQIREAVGASKAGFDDILRRMPEISGHPRGERVVEGTFWARARELGNDVGYDTIAAAGDHACYLHWTDNDGAVQDGQLILIDAGVEVDSLYTADVTRTVPVSGRFSARQREVYEAVREAADAAFAVARPGVRFRDVHNAALEVIARKTSEWGLLPIPLEQTLDTEWQLHRRFMVHGTSHHLGLDVHDCAQARREMYQDALLEPGMVFTIEPGLYFQADDLTIPEDFRGIGVRIEDDVLVTDDGVESLTASFPRTADEVEEWCASPETSE